MGKPIIFALTRSGNNPVSLTFDVARLGMLALKTKTAQAYFNTDDDVLILKTAGGYFIDGERVDNLETAPPYSSIDVLNNSGCIVGEERTSTQQGDRREQTDAAVNEFNLIKPFIEKPSRGTKSLDVKKNNDYKNLTVLTLLVELRHVDNLTDQDGKVLIKNGLITNNWSDAYNKSPQKNSKNNSDSDFPYAQFVVPNIKMTLTFNKLFKYAIIRAENGNMFNQGQSPADELGPVEYTLGSPCSSICFASGTKILTQYGPINIENINSNYHTTYDGRKIVAITKTTHKENFLIKIPKNALGRNSPIEDTTLTGDHLILLNKKMIKAVDLEDYNGIKAIPYLGDCVYNVLLEKHGIILANNIYAESLNPELPIAKAFANKINLSLNKFKEEVNKIQKFEKRSSINFDLENLTNKLLC